MNVGLSFMNMDFRLTIGERGALVPTETFYARWQHQQKINTNAHIIYAHDNDAAIDDPNMTNST